MRDYLKTAIDKRSTMVDLLKYVGTLSFGAIVLISGFLQSLRDIHDHKVILIMAILSFFLCVVFSVTTCIMVARYINVYKWGKVYAGTASFCLKCSLACFFVGVVSLLYFVLVNI